MQNLFWRFGITRNLSFMVFKGNYPYPDKDYTKELLTDPTDLQDFHGFYDIFCEHSLYNEVHLMKKMQQDIARIGIVREPLSQLQSTFTYYHVYAALGLKEETASIHKFLQNPQFYMSRSKLVNYNWTQHLIKNSVAWEFGYRDDLNLKEYLKFIETKFTVLVLEMLDESLVVMKRKLCWSLKDVLYVPMRKRSYTHQVNESFVELHKIWSPHDYAFYNYFKEVMVDKIATQGENFQGEVEWFKNLSDKTKAFCGRICQMLGDGVRKGRKHDYMRHWLEQIISFEANEWDSQGFNISGYECVMMMFDPNVYRMAQRVKQWPGICLGQRLPGTDMRKVRPYCSDHFAYTFPWKILYKPASTFLFDCY